MRRGLATLLVLAISTLAPARTVAGGDEAPGASDYAGAVSAWQSRNASAVRRLIPEKGRLTLDLEGTSGDRVTGRPTAENAEAVLKEYFAKLDSATLKDVTAADLHGFTRTYDYTYRPTGAAAKTTRLTFTLTAQKGGGYGLVGVEERPKKS